MKYGVNSPGFGQFADPRVLAELARIAEDAGWDGYFIWDHIYFSAPGAPVAPIGDPWVTLAGMATRTSVTFAPDAKEDTFVLNGTPATGETLSRVSGLLDRVRKIAGLSTRARVASSNDFPTASGLASSASAFAALAVAAARAAKLDLDEAALSDLARKTSVSAARRTMQQVLSVLQTLRSSELKTADSRASGEADEAPTIQAPPVPWRLTGIPA